jgi:SAM-dependent methyltransferase
MRYPSSSASSHAPLYPETSAGGFSSVDGSVEFYGRLNALLRKDMTLLDFGAGRGKDAFEDPVPYRRELRNLRGKVRRVIGADIDPIVATNPSLDSAVVLSRGCGLPFRDESVDIILADFTFEHITEPELVTRELDRVLKCGGWICARTPNRWGYIAIGATIVPNRLHTRALSILQPERQPGDVFSTSYRLNTPAVVARFFPPDRYVDCSYYYNSEPAYFGSSLVAARVARTVSRLLPARLSALLMIFLQKKT